MVKSGDVQKYLTKFARGSFTCPYLHGYVDMAQSYPELFDFEERLATRSAKGDHLEHVNGLIDFDMFRPAMEATVPKAAPSWGGRVLFDHLVMFRVLIIQAMHSLADERAEFRIKRPVLIMSYLGFGMADNIADAHTI